MPRLARETHQDEKHRFGERPVPFEPPGRGSKSFFDMSHVDILANLKLGVNMRVTFGSSPVSLDAETNYFEDSSA